MGTSIDSAVTKWEKRMEKFTKPSIFAVYKREGAKVEEQEIFDEYFHMLSDVGALSFFEDEFDDSNFSQAKFDIYAVKTTDFINRIKDEKDNPLKEWLLKTAEQLALEGKPCLVYGTYNTFVFSSGLEEYEKNMWVPTEYHRLNEDGKLLHMAISNLSGRYGISLSSVMVSAYELADYEEGTSRGEYIDEIIQRDTTYLANLMEIALQTMKADEKDEFFEERMPRLQILLDALKNGAKFVYSY